MKRKVSPVLIWSVLVSLSLAAQAGAQNSDVQTTGGAATRASSAPDLDRLEEITRQILLKEIDLDRFNMHFRQEVSRQGRWKGWRYFLTQEANFGLSTAASIVTVDERMANIHKPDKPSRQVLKHSAGLQVIGSILSASGSGIELGVNEFNRYKAFRKGFSPGVAKKRVWKTSAEINQLMAERNDIIKSMLAQPDLEGQARIAQAEGKVLEDILFLLRSQYQYYHLDARRVMAFQQSLYLLDIAKRTCGAVAGGIGYRSERLGIRADNQSLGVVTTVSGALIITAPILSREIGKLSVIYHQRHLGIEKATKKDVLAAVAALDADRAAMDRLIHSANQDAVRPFKVTATRLALYDTVDKEFLNDNYQSLKEERSGVLSATENILAGLFSGSTTTVSGIMFLRAGYIYPDNGTISNSLLAAGATANLPGNAFALADNTRIQFNRELAYQRARKRHVLPDQLINARLAELDAMEKQVKEAK